MKRCPQCEFIYEDDQSLCDMDGVLLVFDSRTLPNSHAIATVPPVPANEPARRNRAVPAFATLILALVLGLVYYVSTRPNTAYIPAVVNSVAAEPAPVVVAPTPEATPEERTQPQPPPIKEEKETKPAVATKAPAKKATTKPTSTTQTKAAEPKKEGSKVNSILKKTGRILKKPFKF